MSRRRIPFPHHAPNNTEEHVGHRHKERGGHPGQTWLAAPSFLLPHTTEALLLMANGSDDVLEGGRARGASGERQPSSFAVVPAQVLLGNDAALQHRGFLLGACPINPSSEAGGARGPASKNHFVGQALSVCLFA